MNIWDALNRDENPPRLCTVQGKVMVSPSALVRLVGVEMMVAMGEVAGVEEEAKVRRARESPIGPVHSLPICLLASTDQLMYWSSVSGVEW